VYRCPADRCRVREPLRTVSTVDSAALVLSELGLVDVADCHLRMISTREPLEEQRFPKDYIVRGNLEEQTMQAGNAVSVNVAHWLGRRLAPVLWWGSSWPAVTCAAGHVYIRRRKRNAELPVSSTDINTEASFGLNPSRSATAARPVANPSTLRTNR
jgi:hypothetical protein